MAQHKWHKEIKAWADGAEIEVKYMGQNWWGESNPDWNYEDAEFRIKPQPKEPKYLYVYESPSSGYIALSDILRSDKNYNYIGKIKLEVEDD